MEKSKMVPAPIDNKNVLEDWIYDDAIQNWIASHSDSGSHRSIVGYKGNALVNAEWDFGYNVVRFRLIEGSDSFLEEFAEKLRENTNDGSSFIYTTVEVHGDSVYVEFWYDED